MHTRLLMAVLTIATATSCVPQPSAPKPPPQPKVVADPRQLLRQLDLAVPDDVAALAFRQQYAGYEPSIDLTPSPMAEPVIAEGGITVHYGGESEDGSVVIHHNATPHGPVTQVAQLTSYAGVRVHRNVDAPQGDYAGDAIVSEDGI